MPYTEDRPRKGCQWICHEIGSCKGDCKSTVLHSDFDGNGSCLIVLNMLNFRCAKSDSHSAEIVKHHNSENQKSAA